MLKLINSFGASVQRQLHGLVMFLVNLSKPVCNIYGDKFVPLTIGETTDKRTTKYMASITAKDY